MSLFLAGALWAAPNPFSENYYEVLGLPPDGEYTDDQIKEAMQNGVAWLNAQKEILDQYEQAMHQETPDLSPFSEMKIHNEAELRVARESIFEAYYALATVERRAEYSERLKREERDTTDGTTGKEQRRARAHKQRARAGISAQQRWVLDKLAEAPLTIKGMQSLVEMARNDGAEQASRPFVSDRFMGQLVLLLEGDAADNVCRFLREVKSPQSVDPFIDRLTDLRYQHRWRHILETLAEVRILNASQLARVFKAVTNPRMPFDANHWRLLAVVMENNILASPNPWARDVCGTACGQNGSWDELAELMLGAYFIIQNRAISETIHRARIPLRMKVRMIYELPFDELEKNPARREYYLLKTLDLLAGDFSLGESLVLLGRDSDSANRFKEELLSRLGHEAGDTGGPRRWGQVVLQRYRGALSRTMRSGGGGCNDSYRAL